MELELVLKNRLEAPPSPMRFPIWLRRSVNWLLPNRSAPDQRELWNMIMTPLGRLDSFITATTFSRFRKREIGATLAGQRKIPPTHDGRKTEHYRSWSMKK